ncbi:metallopeptidase family protein [Acuticoccus kandeliae]|uniref:metallopeptidase family protein n=1 Tax=Acuticoccus kandeliae TaxID=2073160 RepID=UPI000D3EC284|nr:metallopeptidase family protein [Acuticoccus kandeliae]
MISLDAFAALAKAEYDKLPDSFRALTGSVQISVADDPTDEMLDTMDLDDPDELLGLFEGFGMAEGLAEFTGQMPNRIWLFRRPILHFLEDGEGEDDIEAVVRHVLIHEIGHHFGLSDDDMYAIDDSED